MKKLGLALVLVVGILATASPAFGQATRTWVSGVGDDVNPCSRTAPCKTWAGAISKTFIGGEINALDPGGFGAVTITKSITLDGGSAFASTLASGVTGVAINITPNANDPNMRVTLRNLSINGTGTSGTVGTNTGINGVRIDSAKAVQLESVRIANFGQNGVDFTPTATADATLSLNDVTVAENLGNGLLVGANNATQDLDVVVRDSLIQGSRGTFGTVGERGIGVSADTGAHVRLIGTTIFDNLIGVKTFNRAAGTEGRIDSFCGTVISGNVENGTAIDRCTPPAAPIVVNPPAPVVVTNTVTTPGPTVTVQAPQQCVVPDLRGLTPAIAARLLKTANCALGTVTRKTTTARSKIGKVTAQKLKAGAKLAKGTKVAVTVGAAAGKAARRAVRRR